MKHHRWSILQEAFKASQKVLLERLGIFVVVLIIIVINTGFLKLDWFQLENWWGKLLDPLAGLFTFLIATWLLVSEIRKNYLDQLDKRLSVYFQTPDNNLIFYAHQVTLTSEADIRQWGQQVGAQANFNTEKNKPGFLSFTSFFTINGPKTILASKENERRFFREWTLSIFLQKEGYEQIKKRYDDDKLGQRDHTQDVLILASPDGEKQAYYWWSDLKNPEVKLNLPAKLQEKILAAVQAGRSL